MVAARARLRRLAIGLLTVYALVLHTLVAGPAGGAQAAGAFQIICSADGSYAAPGATGAPSNQHRMPDCCLSGCPTVGAAIAPAMPVVFAAAPVRGPACAPVLPKGIGASNERSPGAPRGPPAAA